MKLLIVAQKYPPIVGGGETHIQNLAEGVVDRGHQVTVLTSRPSPEMAVEPYRTRGVDVQYIPEFTAACELGSCRAALEALFRAIRDAEADVVHVYNHVPAMLMAWLRTGLSLPICVSLFETHVPGVRVFDLYQNYELERVLQRTLLKQLEPELLIAGSRAYRRWALDAGFPDERIRVIPFATEVERFARANALRHDARQRLGVADDFVILVPARVVPRKRIEDAIVALGILSRTQVKTKLVLMHAPLTSNSAYFHKLKRMIGEQRLESEVIWAEGTSWQQMPEMYGACDAVVLPSSHEGFGIALIEAMAARRPVITTEVEGHDEVVVDGETGYLYPAGNARALACALTKVATANQTDIIERASQRVQSEFSVDTMIRRHVVAYEDVLRVRHTVSRPASAVA